MSYIMNLRKYIGHEPLIGLGATTLNKMHYYLIFAVIPILEGFKEVL